MKRCDVRIVATLQEVCTIRIEQELSIYVRAEQAYEITAPDGALENICLITTTPQSTINFSRPHDCHNLELKDYKSTALPSAPME